MVSILFILFDLFLNHTLQENIPVQYRSLPGTLKLIKTLLANTPSPFPLHPRIQSIIFPRHHRDQPTSLPVCKGFALVALTFLQDVNYVLEKWPWETVQIKAEAVENRSQVLEDAAKFGVRSTTKERWDALKADYLLFRQQLVEEINEAQEKEQASRRHLEAALAPPPGLSAPTSLSHDRHEKNSVKGKDVHVPTHATAVKPPMIHANSLYPSGCLVFVRHLHPDTNKTTLRALFAHAWSADAGASSSGKPADGIDYLDYMKGMDSVRFTFGIAYKFMSLNNCTPYPVSYPPQHTCARAEVCGPLRHPSHTADVWIRQFRHGISGSRYDDHTRIGAREARRGVLGKGAGKG